MINVLSLYYILDQFEAIQAITNGVVHNDAGTGYYISLDNQHYSTDFDLRKVTDERDPNEN